MATMDLTNEVVRLRAELEKVSTERDMLLCEVSNLRRELELSELKHLQDDVRPPPYACLLLPLFGRFPPTVTSEGPPALSKDPFTRASSSV
ncbi:hypothetical protein PYW07_011112 [Mythimna separata]|uniref:Uncharacterized protein n=1 Tax=Mythimna separata TaxID=271217 RepID=A0AAD8DKY4_MYTSE|nr:hypothetical protein PYW07_011112 [Mythimna separata]